MQDLGAQELKHWASMPHINSKKAELCVQEISEEGRQAHPLMWLSVTMQVVLTMGTEY